MKDLGNRSLDFRKKINDKNDDNNRPIDLVANSGIQFLDFEFDMPINLGSTDRDDDDYVPKYIINGQFDKVGEHYIRCNEEEYQNDLDNDDDRTTIVKMIDSLNLYNGVWFPIPYYVKGQNQVPTNWARARVINLSDIDQRSEGGEYHVTLAFDTAVDNENMGLHCAPTSNDINNYFIFGSAKDASDQFINGPDGMSFVREWAKSVCEQIYPINNSANSKRMDEIKDIWNRNNNFEKHYLNLVAFLEYFVQPNNIKLVPFEEGGSNSVIDVSLILDVGNSRSSGILVEEDSSKADSLKSNPQLEIRDLNAVENLYVGTFDSKIQFQQANFDFYNCSSKSSRLYAFSWPSLVRVGTEASKLAARIIGTEGKSGLTSPKRYLWQLDSSSKKKEEWQFNNSYYQIPMMEKNKDNEFEESFFIESKEPRSAIWGPISECINNTGDARFADTGAESKMESNYTGKSTMTFMLMEIFMQAMMQMNSYHYRQSKSSAKCPRRLKAIVLTYPPSMSELEREVFRSCAYQAVGLIWKTYHYDKTPATEFKFEENKKQMYPAPPEISLEWNETLAGQLVYIYNETQRVFSGRQLDFIKHLRRKDAKGRINEYNKEYVGRNKAEYVSARVATIDIGGGTTDLVIADYSCPCANYVNDERRELGNQDGFLEIREILKEGYKIAGDDLVLELINKKVIEQICNNTLDITPLFAKKTTDIKEVKKRVQLVEQVFTKIAYRIISRLEHLTSVKAGMTNVVATGTIADFINGTDDCLSIDSQAEIKSHVEKRELALKQEKLDIYAVDSNVIEYINTYLGMNAKDFLKRPLEFDIYKLNREIAYNGSYNLCNSLDLLNSIVNAYCCDVLILTGRPSKIPAIRTLIESKSYLSPRRIINLHEYDCESWYPAFTLENGKIGDPKTTVVVGALLGFIKHLYPNSLENFRVNTDYQEAGTAIRYLGIVDNSDNVKDEEVCFKFSTKAENIIKLDKTDKPINQIMTQEEANKAFVDKDAETGLKVTTGVPALFGYRQFRDEKLKGSMLYSLEVYDDARDLKRVKDAQKLRAPSMEELEFTDEFKAHLNDTLFSKIYSKTNVEGKNYQQQALDLFDSIRPQMEKFIIDRDNCLTDDPDAENAEEVRADNMFISIVGEFNDKVKAYSLQKADENKPKGLFSKFSYSEKDREADLKKYRIEYRSIHGAEALKQLKDAIEAKNQALRSEFLRGLSMILNKSFEDLIEDCEKKLAKVLSAQRHLFDITFDFDDTNMKDSLVGKSVGFIKSQQKDLVPTLRLLKLTGAKENAKGDLITEEIGDNLFNFFRLRLKTINGNDEYWNNDGLIL